MGQLSRIFYRIEPTTGRKRIKCVLIISKKIFHAWMADMRLLLKRVLIWRISAYGEKKTRMRGERIC